MDDADFIVESSPIRTANQLDNIQKRAVRIIDWDIHNDYSVEALERVY